MGEVTYYLWSKDLMCCSEWLVIDDSIEDFCLIVVTLQEEYLGCWY